MKYDIVVLGLGVTGYATAAYCTQRGLKVAITDNRERPPLAERLRKNYPSIEVTVAEYDYEILKQAKRVVISPGIHPKDPVVKWLIENDKEVISDIDLFLEKYQGKIIAVTGSNGKSTTVKMLNDLINISGMKACMIGNIGKPVLQFLMEETERNCDWVIIEVSSFQLHWTQSMRADIGVVLNIYPNHLDWHSSYYDYKKAKISLLENSTQGVMPLALKQLVENTSIINRIKEWIPSYSCLNESSLAIESRVIDALPYALHKSAIAACIIAKLMNIETYHCCRALEEFQPWPFRCQHESSSYGVWYNDAKSSNLAAARYAIESVSRRHGSQVIWIAGGVTKNEEFSEVARWARKFISQAVVYGQDRELFLEALIGVCPVSPVATLDEAMKLVKRTMKKTDVIVYSPAAASFDQFENFQHRGQFFSEQLLGLLPV